MNIVPRVLLQLHFLTMENYVDKGQHVILLWGNSTNSDHLKGCVNKLRDQVEDVGSVAVENLSMLLKCNLKF